MEVKVSGKAYGKIMCHCLRWPHCGVVGVLVGTVTPTCISVSDAIPISHSVPLAPFTEAALEMASDHCPHGQVLCGSYWAPEIIASAASVAASSVPARIAEKCAANASEATSSSVRPLVLVVDNAAASASPHSGPAVVAFAPSSQSAAWKSDGVNVKAEWEGMEKLLSGRDAREVVDGVADVEGYFSDPKNNDWRNALFPL